MISFLSLHQLTYDVLLLTRTWDVTLLVEKNEEICSILCGSVFELLVGEVLASESGDLLQRLQIQQWKWDRITMDLVVGLPQTFKKFDVVWVIVDRLTKSAHFIPVVTTYSLEQLAQIYISEIVRHIIFLESCVA